MIGSGFTAADTVVAGHTAAQKYNQKSGMVETEQCLRGVLCCWETRPHPVHTPPTHGNMVQTQEYSSGTAALVLIVAKMRLYVYTRATTLRHATHHSSNETAGKKSRQYMLYSSSPKCSVRSTTRFSLASPPAVHACAELTNGEHCTQTPFRAKRKTPFQTFGRGDAPATERLRPPTRRTCSPFAGFHRTHETVCVVWMPSKGCRCALTPETNSCFNFKLCVK